MDENIYFKKEKGVIDVIWMYTKRKLTLKKCCSSQSLTFFSSEFYLNFYLSEREKNQQTRSNIRPQKYL